MVNQTMSVASSSKLEGLIAAFTPGGDAFALGTPDGLVRTYDTGAARCVGRLCIVKQKHI